MSSASEGGVFSSADGSTFTNLAIAGVGSLSGDSPIAPNMNISLPGVGYVVLNEQIPSGDGVSSSGLTGNMIHVRPLLDTPSPQGICSFSTTRSEEDTAELQALAYLVCR